MSATYTKLKSGEWGIRVEGAAKKGDRVTVAKRDGTTKVETVVKVVWSGNGISLCAIEQREKAAAYTPRAGRAQGGGGQTCAECGRGGRLVADLEDGMLKHYACCDIPPGGY